MTISYDKQRTRDLRSAIKKINKIISEIRRIHKTVSQGSLYTEKAIHELERTREYYDRELSSL